MLTRDQILGADDLPRQEVRVPEWGGSVHVRTMTGSERDRWEVAQLKDPETDVRARLAVHTVCDAAGRLLFAPADIPSIGAKSSKALDRIFAAAQRLNRISKQDVDELAKNS